MPITGHDGLLVGIVTSTDLLKYVASRDPLLVQESPFWKRDVPESAI
jgi:CBS domain-containing protein